LQIAAIIVVIVVGFVGLQHPARVVETEASAAILRALGSSRVTVEDTSILVVPFHGSGFRAIVSPSCSSIASLLSVCCLAALVRAGSRRRRAAAFVTSAGTVFAGNVVRISASLAVGLFAGRSSLVLFHDWVGSIFSFAYTLGGFVLLLYLMLPRRHKDLSGPTNVAVG
jgi:carbamoyl-phosphate synthase large subunit